MASIFARDFVNPTSMDIVVAVLVVASSPSSDAFVKVTMLQLQGDASTISQLPVE